MHIVFLSPEELNKRKQTSKKKKKKYEYEKHAGVIFFESFFHFLTVSVSFIELLTTTKTMMVAQRPPNEHPELLQPGSNQEIDRMYRKSFLEYAKHSVNLKDKVCLISSEY